MARHDTADKLEVLQRSWRKVASTHNLQDLLRPDEPASQTPATWQTRLCGALLILVSVVAAATATWVLVVHFLPLSSSPWVRAVQQDWYYCCLVPLTLPVAAFAAGLHWFSLKLFKHNS